jgi:hypothetical protein
VARLNQIIAVEVGARTSFSAALARALSDLGNPAINGFTKTYEPRATVDGEPGEQEPDQSQKVQITGERVLAELSSVLARMCDVVLTKDLANMEAVADVIVDGDVLLEAVPTSYLLFLENQLGELRKVIKALPVLDPKEDWHQDPARGMHAAAPRVTTAKKRKQKPEVLYRHTPEHPAQVALVESEEIVGDWTNTKLSGAFEADRINDLMARWQKLKDAVLQAREHANMINVADRPGAGQRLAEYLLG